MITKRLSPEYVVLGILAYNGHYAHSLGNSGSIRPRNFLLDVERHVSDELLEAAGLRKDQMRGGLPQLEQGIDLALRSGCLKRWWPAGELTWCKNDAPTEYFITRILPNISLAENYVIKQIARALNGPPVIRRRDASELST